MTRRVLAGLAASVLVLAVANCDREPSVEASCARTLNVEWSRDDGATERLTEFAACVEAGR